MAEFLPRPGCSLKAGNAVGQLTASVFEPALLGSPRGLEGGRAGERKKENGKKDASSHWCVGDARGGAGSNKSNAAFENASWITEDSSILEVTFS